LDSKRRSCQKTLIHRFCGGAKINKYEIKLSDVTRQ
jgi:hypothetical protein